jgi:hypothetical protein
LSLVRRAPLTWGQAVKRRSATQRQLRSGRWTEVHGYRRAVAPRRKAVLSAIIGIAMGSHELTVIWIEGGQSAVGAGLNDRENGGQDKERCNGGGGEAADNGASEWSGLAAALAEA